MKNILVLSSGSSVDSARLCVAEALAERHGAVLSVLMVNPTPIVTAPYGLGMVGLGAEATPLPATDIRDHTEGTSNQASIEARFANRQNVRLLRIDDTTAGIQDRTAELCRTKDLFIASMPGGEDRVSGSLLQAILNDGAAPVLALPEETDPHPLFRRVCIAWNGSVECARALKGAMPIVQLAETVSVIMVDQLRPAGGEIVEKTEVEFHLEAHGVHAEMLPVASGDMKTAGALIAEAERLGAELLIAGGHDRSGILSWLSFNVSKDLLRKGTLPLFLAR